MGGAGFACMSFWSGGCESFAGPRGVGRKVCVCGGALGLAVGVLFGKDRRRHASLCGDRGPGSNETEGVL
jgi:hypothetical protein